jgi:N-ethylmaleimide reductase
VSLDAIGYINTAGIHTDEQVEVGKSNNQTCVHDKAGKSLFNWHVGRMSHPDFHNGHYHYLRQLSIPNDKAFTQKDLKLLLRQRK